MSSARSRLNDKAFEKLTALYARTDQTSQTRNNDNVHYNSNVMNIPETKWVQIYVNGDEHFSGCRCVVNSRYYRNFEMFLNYLTERLQPSFGAVRNIYTPVNGHSVLSLDDLIPRQKYVVAGNERFKKLEPGYAEIGAKKLRRNTFKPKSKFKVSKAKPMCHNALSLNLYRNGHHKMKPNRVIFTSQEIENWESLYKKICEALKCGPIKRICSLSGKPMKNVEELINNQSYVVIGKHEVFKNGLYGNAALRTNSSSKEKYHILRPSRKSSSVITTRSSGVYSRSSAHSMKFRFSVSRNKSNDGSPLVSSAALSKNDSIAGSVENIPSFTDAEIQVLQDSRFNEDYVTKIKIDLDDDFGGIFRSKAQNDLTAGAVEIEDSPETTVDLPVDLLEAEEVEDDITPDMERSLQHLSLDVPEEIVAFLPTMPKKQSGEEHAQQSSTNKYNLSHSQTLDIRNIYV